MPEVPSQDILVVDDEQSVCELLAEALSYIGHNVHTACDGKDAVEKLHHANFSIVITDIDMPRMDGIELIKYLVQEPNGIDVIAITGHTMKYKYTDVIAAGASDFITKPFTLNELEAKLNRLIRERYLRHELERLAIRDPLTGLYNRRFFQKIVRKEVVRAVRYKHSLCLFFIDIDYFKKYNDENGHQAGDALLVRFADLLETSIREHVDMAFRFGGDEFTVLLPHLTRDQAGMVAERIRQKYNQLEFKPTSISIGVTQFAEKTGDIEKDIEEMILRSDKALYHAKHRLCGDKVCWDGESVLFNAAAEP